MLLTGRSGVGEFRNARLNYSFLLVLLVTALLAATNAAAQETKREWTVSYSGGVFGKYKTQQEAEAAILTIPGPAPFFTDAYQYVKSVKETVVAEDGVTITYWMGKEQPEVPEWGYRWPGNQMVFASEQEVVEDMKNYFDGKYSTATCPPSTTAVPAGDWTPKMWFGNGVSTLEIRDYSVHWIFESGSPPPACLPSDTTTPISRFRLIHCPNDYTQWSNEYQACVNEEITATVTTKILECDKNGGGGNCSVYREAETTAGGCDGMVGNPCDVKTGEKYEAELDFELGWIKFWRSFHSGMSNFTGGFGYGWSHSYQLRLSIHNSEPTGLILGTGFQKPFRKVGSEYVAADGSGDRLVGDSDGWVLYQADKVVSFNIDGRVESHHYEDGTALAFQYDDYDRLDAITHSSGRSLQFHYSGTSDRAPIAKITSSGILLASYTYTAEGQIETVTYPDGYMRIYHYEDQNFPGNLTGITAENGLRFSTFAYDLLGRVVSSQHAGGADGVALAYTPTGGAVVTDALGLEINYGLTADPASNRARKVGTITDSAGTVSMTYYDEAVDFRRRLDTVTDRNGTQTKHVYAEGVDAVTGFPVHIHTIKEAAGLPEERISEERRDLASNRLLAMQIGGREIRVTRNDRLQPISTTVKDIATGLTRTTAYAYCEETDVANPNYLCPILGLLKSVDGPRTGMPDITTYMYYPEDDAACATEPTACFHRRGDLWRVTNALGFVTKILAYDNAGRPLSVEDANGVVTDYAYHPRGWLTARKVRGTDDAVETDDQITRIEYWPTGLVKQVTQPDGTYLGFTYDAAQRLTDIVDSAGNTIHYTLDNAGNRVQEDTKDAGGALKHTLSRVYNQLDQLVTLADADANPTDFAFDVDGNVDTVTDALARVADNNYDVLDRLVRTLQDVGGIQAETLLEYDAHDNLTKVTDPGGLETTYTYNGFGDLVQLLSPDTGATSYTYDSGGNRFSQVDARGNTVYYLRDVLNRIDAIYYMPTGESVIYGYDSVRHAACPESERFTAGKLTWMSNSSGSTDYCYDRFGNLVRKVQKTNYHFFTLRYTYTKAGRISSITYPDGAVVDYVRNAQGQVTEIGVAPSGGVRQVLVNQVDYYPFGPTAGWTYGNGRSLLRTYNQNYQPLAVLDGNTGGLSLGYEFDGVGNLARLNDGFHSAALARYDYDGLNRLTDTRDGPTGTVIEHYGYDSTGNRTSLTNAGGTATYAYAAGSHRLMQVGGVSRSYDAVGNTTQIGATRQFVYGLTGRLSQVKVGGSVVMNYHYNGRGEQVWRGNSAANIYTVYDEAGHWIGDYDSTGATIQQAIWLDDLPAGLLVGAGSNQKLHYVEPDHLGTPRVVIDPIRDVTVWKWDAKGEVFGNTVPDQDPDGDGTAFVFDMRFPGQRYDAASGLNYNYFRDYDPGSGRYIQSDPIGLTGGINTYAYTSGNPVNRIDPSGLLWYGGHFSITYRAARSSGFGFRDSLRLAWKVMAVDWRQGSQGTTPDATKLHAMASPGQSCPDATKAADDLIAGKDPDYANDIAARIHAAQDASAPWHYGQTWDGHITSGHVWNDVFYGDAVGDAAYDATMGILGGGP